MIIAAYTTYVDLTLTELLIAIPIVISLLVGFGVLIKMWWVQNMKVKDVESQLRNLQGTAASCNQTQQKRWDLLNKSLGDIRETLGEHGAKIDTVISLVKRNGKR